MAAEVVSQGAIETDLEVRISAALTKALWWLPSDSLRHQTKFRFKLGHAQIEVNGVAKEKAEGRADMGEVMNAAGLTHGGFYRHFSNREQLFEEGLQQAMAASGKMMADRAAAGGISNAIKGYLSSQHRDEAVPRCPYAAMGSELARHPSLKDQAWAGVSAQIATLAQTLGGDDDAKDRATLMFALMMGAMTLSRMAADKNSSNNILALAQRESLEIAVGGD